VNRPKYPWSFRQTWNYENTPITLLSLLFLCDILFSSQPSSKNHSKINKQNHYRRKHQTPDLPLPTTTTTAIFFIFLSSSLLHRILSFLSSSSSLNISITIQNHYFLSLLFFFFLSFPLILLPPVRTTWTRKLKKTLRFAIGFQILRFRDFSRK